MAPPIPSKPPRIPAIKPSNKKRNMLIVLTSHPFRNKSFLHNIFCA
jgi:hypothetical protein